MAERTIYYDPLLGKVVVAQVSGAFGAPGRQSPVFIENKSDLNKLLVTTKEGKYLVNREEYIAPANPTISVSAKKGYNEITLASTSGASIYYTLDGNEPTSNSTKYTGKFNLNADNSMQTKTYTVKAIAYKNDIASEVTGLTVNVNRCVAVRYTLGGDNYDTSRTLTIFEQTAGAGYQYYDGVWHNITFTNGEFSLNVSSSCTIKIKGTKDSWESSEEISVVITVGKNMCYIGQAAALSSETDIKALANAYKQDTLVGSTKEVDCGSTAEYVWICIPNTAARNLTVKNGGFAVPLLSAAGTVIGAYRVWRTESKLKETYNFEII